LQTFSSSDTNLSLEVGFKVPVTNAKSIPLWAYKTGHAYFAENVNLDSKYLPLKALSKANSEIAVPLQFGLKTIGVLDIYNENIGSFPLEDRMILQTLANQIAIAIRNARLYNSEQKIRQLEEQRAADLTELNASKDKLFSIIAHDLKGPFLPLLGWLDMLSEMVDTASPDKIKHTVQVTYRSAKNVYNLLENLLSWSKMQMQRMEYYPIELDLKMAINLNILLLGTTAFNKSITIENNIIKSFNVYADEDMLHTIIRNLISNGLKFTNNGGVVSIEAHEIDELIEVRFIDNGIGISPENIEKLFKIEDSYTTLGTADEKGTGFGLIMCKEMVECNSGKIWIESTFGKGTTVIFTVPKA